VFSVILVGPDSMKPQLQVLYLGLLRKFPTACTSNITFSWLHVRERLHFRVAVSMAARNCFQTAAVHSSCLLSLVRLQTEGSPKLGQVKAEPPSPEFCCPQSESALAYAGSRLQDAQDSGGSFRSRTLMVLSVASLRVTDSFSAV
jgi:hypothetical protein